MPAFTTVLSVAALAGSLVQAAPLLTRAKPSNYYEPYLEPYDTYHLRYLAISCQTQHNTTFFDECCHPLLSTEKLEDQPTYCTPNATEIASASSYIASTSLYGVPTTTVGVAATTTASADADEVSEYSAAAASTSASASKSTSTSQAAPSTQAGFAQQSTSTSTYVAPTTTSTYVAPTTTSTYVAPTTTSTYQAAATTTQAASSGGSSVQSGGYATYFYQGGNAGACGNYNSDSSYIVAIDSAWWSNFGTQSQYCGKSLTIKNTNNGKTVSAVVADVCPTCVNGNSLDLSVGAFTAIASTSDGMVPIQWWWN